MPTRRVALKRNARSAHALWMGVDPPGNGRNREGVGLRMPKAKRVQKIGTAGRSGRRPRKSPAR